VRKQVGLWLHAHVAPGQTVSSESAGYVGWYGRVKLYDYPGLTSPTSYKALQRLGPSRNTYPELINALRPNWLVMRPIELLWLRQGFPGTAREYRVVRQFGTPPGIAHLWHDGLEYVNIDTDFLVLRRTTG
jgi:hypothetical protein